ncbi:MAG TPA: pantoate--beta-alanine ligase [Rubricoccaceae bacterium]
MTPISTVAAMQAEADAARAAGRRLALVPTMGALHAGHLALVQDARRRVGPAGHVTVSVFVNPTQFAPGEDFEAYPRTLAADRAALDGLGEGAVDAVFAPLAPEMYPFGLPPFTTVAVRDLDGYLCGAARPGHFEGVTTVVAKLFLACRPHVAVFGEKDAQQLAILRRMADEMGFGVEVAGHAIVREADGLALSSRNRYLSDLERGEALVLSRAVFAARDAVAAGETSVARIEAAMQAEIAQAPGVRVQYAQVVDALGLQPVETLSKGGPSAGRYLAAVAAFVGTTRLIDNATLAIGDPS